MSAPLLSVHNLQKRFASADGPVPVLRGVSFTLDAGQTLALVGESGSGKSTLLHVVGGLDTADGGEVRLGETEISALDDRGRAALRRSRVSVVFQQFNLIPSLDVRANLAFQARLAGRHDAGWCDTLAERLGLAAHLSKYPEQLSGGQQQRVAIGRTLATRPELVLADEPTGNLDEETGRRVVDLMLELVSETGAALLCATHSTTLAGRMDRQLTLSRGCLA